MTEFNRNDDRPRGAVADFHGITRRQVSKIRQGRMTLREAHDYNELHGRTQAQNYPVVIEAPINTRKKNVPGTASWHYGHHLFMEGAR